MSITPLFKAVSLQRRLIPLVLLGLFGLLAIGCNDRNTIQNAAGRYDGLVTERPTGSQAHQYFVSGALDKVTDNFYNLILRTVNESRTWWIQVHILGQNELRLTSNYRGTSTLNRVELRRTSEFCFATASADTRLCIHGTEVYVELPRWVTGTELSIVADRVDSARHLPQMEPSRTFSIREIIDRSMNLSFDSRVEFERVVQSRLNAQHASLSLLPRISASTILSFIVFGPLGPFAVIGDLAPFLFPSRWTRARQAEVTAEADFIGYLIMKADAAHISEGIALTTERDLRIKDMLTNARREVEDMQRDFQFRVAVDIAQPGQLDDFSSTLINIDRSDTTLSRTINAQLRALSLAMGYYNPEAVSGIQEHTPRTISLRPITDKNRLVELALRRSYELRQADLLIQASHLSSAEHHMAWIDPTGNPAGALGFSLPSYLQIGYSQIREMEMRRERTRAQIIQSVYDTIDLIERSQTLYRLSVENVAIQSRRLRTIRDGLALGNAINGTEIALALQEKIRATSELLDAEFGYYIAQAKLNRLLFVGPYGIMNPDMGRAQIERSFAISTQADRP